MQKENSILKNIRNVQFNLKELSFYRKKMFKNIINFWEIDYSRIYNKTNLSTKKGRDGIILKTNGSTGPAFAYKYGLSEFNMIETELHYYEIVEEFGLNKKNNKILRVSPETDFDSNFDFIKWKNINFKIKIFHPKKSDFNYSHGCDEAICYHFKYKKSEMIEFCEFLLDFISKEKMDIFLTSFSFLSMLSECNVKNIKIAKLISNTCESIEESQVEFMKHHKMMDFFCDHMRSWDGGFTFITCKYGEKHILDYLSFVESFENKLISTDYYNYCSPFIRYWNGDHIKIENEWIECKCKRFYRKFTLDGRRKSFTINNISSIDLYDIISKINKTLQVICYKNKIKIISLFELSENEKKYLIENINFNLEFKTNEFEQVGRFNKTLKLIDKTQEYE
jgi:hypothetical protein